MKQLSSLLASLGLVAMITACGKPDAAEHSNEAPPEAGEADHEHAEDPLGTVTIGGLEVDLAQGHGAVVANEEGHLERIFW